MDHGMNWYSSLQPFDFSALMERRKALHADGQIFLFVPTENRETDTNLTHTQHLFS